MKNKQLQIIEHYGVNNQVKKLFEELGELIETIMDNDVKHMEEEYADVENLLEQIREFYDLDKIRINSIKKYKVQRQIERIAKENEQF